MSFGAARIGVIGGWSPASSKASKQDGSLYVHTYTHTYQRTYIHTCMHACMHACMHTRIHTYMHACVHATLHAFMHTCIHAYMHTYAYTHCVCARVYTHLPTYLSIAILIDLPLVRVYPSASISIYLRIYFWLPLGTTEASHCRLARQLRVRNRTATRSQSARLQQSFPVIQHPKTQTTSIPSEPADWAWQGLPVKVSGHQFISFI